MASYPMQPGSWSAIVDIFSTAFAETSKRALSGTSEKALTGRSENPLARTGEKAVTGTSEKALAGTGEKALTGTDEKALTGTSEKVLAGTGEKALSGTSEKQLAEMINKALAGMSKKVGVPRTPLKALGSRESPARRPGRIKLPLQPCPSLTLEMTPKIKFVTDDALTTPFKFAATPAQPLPPPENSQPGAVKYLKSGLLSDVEFVVRSTKFAAARTLRAHKQFLAMRNEVFFATFFGSRPETDSVLITDLHPDGFYGLLKYLYSNESLPESFEDAMYTREAAWKYLVPALALACSEYIAVHITTDKVCPLLDCLATKDPDKVDKAAMNLLKSDAMSVLFSDSFLDAQESTVELVLESIAGVPESCVMLAVKRWAEESIRKCCVSAGGDVKKLQSVMQPFLPKLRFLALSAGEFVNGPASWSVLSEADAYAILRNIIVRDSASLPSWVCTVDKARG